MLVMLNQRHKKKKGNLLVIVLLAALIVALLGSALTNSAQNLYNAKTAAKNATETYSGLACADLFADAFVADLGSQYSQRASQITDGVEFDPAIYVDMIQGTKGVAASMNMTPLAAGKYLYNGDAVAVGNAIDFDESHMESQFALLLKKIDVFKITIAHNFEVDEDHHYNDTSGDSGDRYYLKDVEFTVEFSIGTKEYKQTYNLTGVYALFSHHGGTITGKLIIDEAEWTLISQSLDSVEWDITYINN